jgi:hypothetical protein
MPSGNSGEERDVSVPYLFDRFEQVQAFNLELAHGLRQLDDLDPQDSTILKQIPKKVHLELRQMEGSIIHGKETNLNVRLEQGSRVKRAKEPKTEAEEERGNEEDSEDVSPPEDALSDAAADHAQAITHDAPATIKKSKPLLQTLAQTALDIAHLLTRANAGAIPIPYTKPDKAAQQDVGKEIGDALDPLEADPDDEFSARNVTKGDNVNAAERNRMAVPGLLDELPFDALHELAALDSQATSSRKQSTLTDHDSMSLDEHSEEAVGDTEAARTTVKPRRSLFETD